MIYHGTNAKYLDRILREGLLPTSNTGASNWEHIPSKPDCVYLSRAYALYYANADRDEDSNIALIQLDESKLDPQKLLPDEDFIVEIFNEARHLGETIPDEFSNYTEIEELTNAIDPPRFRGLTKQCLLYYGNLAYEGPISSEAITRHVIVPFDKEHQLIYFLAGDAFTTPMNYHFKGSFYKDLCDATIEGHIHPLATISVKDYLRLPTLYIVTRNGTRERIDGLQRERLRECRGIVVRDVQGDPDRLALYYANIRGWNRMAKKLLEESSGNSKNA